MRRRGKHVALLDRSNTETLERRKEVLCVPIARSPFRLSTLPVGSEKSCLFYQTHHHFTIGIKFPFRPVTLILVRE